MKRKLLALVLAISGANILTHAQSEIQLLNQANGSISIQCNVGDYHITNTGEFTLIHLDEGTPILKSGAPDLERLTSAIIVDDTHEMELTVVSSTYEEFTNIQILPSKGNLLRSVDPNSIPFVQGEPYAVDAFYPGNLAGLDEAYVQHQYRAQSVHFYPLQYNPITKVLRVYSHIQIEVNATSQPGFNPLPANVSSKVNATMREVYENRFLNYTENASRYEQISEIGNILVIADAQYMEELQPWVQWKKEKGFETEVVDVASINSIAAISTFVEDYYNTNGLTYLVFVGDENQIPVELVNNSGGQGYCDACYGYISGNDNYSEVFISRFLVHNDAELVPFINKVLEYEKNPNTSTDWFSVAMGLGSDQGDGIGDDGEADWQHENNIKQDLLDYTYTQVWEKYDGSHSASSPSGGNTADGSGSPTSSSLTTVINNGCSLINYTGHGAHNLIVTGSYTNTQINALDNHGFYPYFIIVGCCTGDYDDDDASGDTFGEAWIKSTNTTAPTGGIGGAFSSVYQSWAPPMEGQDEMNKIITETASINTRHTLGSIHYHGCASMNDAYGGQGDEMTDTWILMADPTVQLRTAMPSPLVATHPASVFIGTSELTISCNTEDAMVGLTVDGEIIGSGFISGGQVTINFDAVQTVTQILVTVTSFNTIPYQAYIEVVPANGPYVSGQFVALNDATGNNNGQADYNETISVDLSAHNTGVETATNVTAETTCSNTAVVMDITSHNYGTVDVDQTVTGQGAYAFHINGYIADQTVVTFITTFTDELGNSWSTSHNITINAPAFACATSYTIDDSLGNGNGRMDSGETVYITVAVTNSGHATTGVGVVVDVSENSSYLTLNTTSATLGMIAAGGTVQIAFTAVVAANAPASEAVALNFITSSDFYGSDCDYEAVINQNIEDWESGNDQTFDWAYAGNADWFVTNQEFFEGTYSMQSGDVGNNQSTILQLTSNFSTAGDVSFMFKTSSEATYDFLTFKMDNVTLGSWSGENDWTLATYPVTAGTHTLRWTYAKDFTASDGSDAAWVDNIIMPNAIVSSVENMRNGSEGMLIYPNPVGNDLNILLPIGQANNMSLCITNSLGQVMFEKAGMSKASGKSQYSIDSAQWSSGIYYVTIKTENGVWTEKVIKR